MGWEMANFPCIEREMANFPCIMRYKHTIVRKSTQIINDHILGVKIFYFFAILEVMLSKEIEPIQQNWDRITDPDID